MFIFFSLRINSSYKVTVPLCLRMQLISFRSCCEQEFFICSLRSTIVYLLKGHGLFPRFKPGQLLLLVGGKTKTVSYVSVIHLTPPTPLLWTIEKVRKESKVFFMKKDIHRLHSTIYNILLRILNISPILLSRQNIPSSKSIIQKGE